METFIYPNHSHAKPLRAFEFLQQKTRIHILECYLPALQETKATIFCHPNNITKGCHQRYLYNQMKNFILLYLISGQLLFYLNQIIQNPTIFMYYTTYNNFHNLCQTQIIKTITPLVIIFKSPLIRTYKFRKLHIYTIQYINTLEVNYIVDWLDCNCRI